MPGPVNQMGIRTMRIIIIIIDAAYLRGPVFEHHQSVKIVTNWGTKGEPLRAFRPRQLLVDSRAD